MTHLAYCELRIAYGAGCGSDTFCVLRIAYCVLRIEPVTRSAYCVLRMRIAY